MTKVKAICIFSGTQFYNLTIMSNSAQYKTLIKYDLFDEAVYNYLSFEDMVLSIIQILHDNGYKVKKRFKENVLYYDIAFIDCYNPTKVLQLGISAKNNLKEVN